MIVYEVGAGSVSVPLPPSANNCYPTGKGGKRFVSPDYRRWLKVAVPILRTLRRPRSYPVGAVFVVEGHLAGTADLDNRIKPILDAAKKAGVLLDDNRSCVWAVQITYRPIPDGDGVRVSFHEHEYA